MEIKMKKRDKRLVAYIRPVDDVPFIDIVEISKKGTSFLYEGVWWKREPIMRIGYCTNEKGEKLEISPLRRSYNPYAEFEGVIDIREEAKKRYELWLAGELKP